MLLVLVMAVLVVLVMAVLVVLVMAVLVVLVMLVVLAVLVIVFLLMLPPVDIVVLCFSSSSFPLCASAYRIASKGRGSSPELSRDGAFA